LGNRDHYCIIYATINNVNVAGLRRAANSALADMIYPDWQAFEHWSFSLPRHRAADQLLDR
jgi:hypothetical protein